MMAYRAWGLGFSLEGLGLRAGGYTGSSVLGL